jgi:hypothetical protein
MYCTKKHTVHGADDSDLPVYDAHGVDTYLKGPVLQVCTCLLRPPCTLPDSINVTHCPLKHLQLCKNILKTAV